MTVQANSSGVVTGKFTIPANVPAGSKRVTFEGSGGSRAEAGFIGQGTITDDVRRRVTSEVWDYYDPLAQTFTIEDTVQIAAIDLWFTNVGTSNIVVQIRETAVGFPTRTVVAERRLTPAEINTTSHTRATFAAPVQLVANTEYAIVVLCDDAVASLRVAELGKWDSNSQRWVTSQPYQVGVLLSSSNASTWTAHQDRDLTFRLHKAVFVESEKVVPLGSVDVTSATDLILLTDESLPASGTRVEYTLGLPGGRSVTASSGQPVQLSEAVTGSVTISAKLIGGAAASPILFPGAQMVVGQVATSGTYVSRAVPAGVSTTVKVIFDAIVPSGATLAIEYKGIDAGDTWQAVPLSSTLNVDDGFVEFTHAVSGVNESAVQIRITLNGTPAARPRMRNLRILTI